MPSEYESSPEMRGTLPPYGVEIREQRRGLFSRGSSLAQINSASLA